MRSPGGKVLVSLLSTPLIIWSNGGDVQSLVFVIVFLVALWWDGVQKYLWWLAHVLLVLTALAYVFIDLPQITNYLGSTWFGLVLIASLFYLPKLK